MILSDNEIDICFHSESTPRAFARAIIAATVAKLSAGVSVEPWTTTKYVSSTTQYELFTRDQLNTAIAAAHLAGRKSVHDKCVDLWKGEFLAAARVAALEEAAKVCEHESCSCCWTEDATELASHLTDSIRALIEKEST